MGKIFDEVRGRARDKRAPRVVKAAADEAARVDGDEERFVVVESLAKVDAHRRRLIADSPALARVLAGIELTLVHQLGRRVRRIERREG